MGITGLRAACESCGNEWNLRKEKSEYEDGPRCSDCGSRSVEIGGDDDEDRDDRILVPPSEEAAEELAGFFEEMADRTGLDLEMMRLLVVEEVEVSGDLPTTGDLEYLINDSPSGVGSEAVAAAIARRYDRFLRQSDKIQNHLKYGNLTLGQIGWSGQSVRVYDE